MMQKQTFPVQGMSCAACAQSVEKVLEQKDGVRKAEVNFASHKVKVQFSEELSPQDLKTALQAVGYDLNLEKQEHAEQQKARHNRYLKVKRQTIWSALFSLPVFGIGLFFPNWNLGPYISAILSLPVLFYWGGHFYRNAFKQARHKLATMDTLVALSTGMAFSFSLFNTLFPEFWLSRGLTPHVYYEAAVIIITFVGLGKTLEERAKGATSKALEQLMDLQVTQVLVRNSEGEEQLKNLEDLHIGAHIRVKPGESMAVDGRILEGNSRVDESMLSGEVIPLTKKPGDRVYAGTLNQQGSLLIECQKSPEDTVLAQIIRLVENAQGSKAPVQDLVNKIAAVFVPIVMLIALLTFVLWWTLAGEQAFAQALYASIAVLVIACPCALGLATPTAIMVGIGKGAAHNILIRDAESLELAPRVDFLILDKTGTLTQAKARVQELTWLAPERSGSLLGLQRFSQHPLAAAISLFLQEKGVKATPLLDFKIVEGQGIEAKNEQGELWRCGNANFLAAADLRIPEPYQAKAKEWETQGGTVVYFFNDQVLLAQILLGDPLKEGSEKALRSLKDHGLELMLLSGDQEATTAFWAMELGFDHYKAQVLPADKGAEVRHWQAQGKTVAMVGDGINDSEALALADLSIAMGHGSSIAIEAAKMTLMTSDLRALPKAFKLAEFTVKGIRQNLFWAFVYNLIGIPLAAGILYPFNGFLIDPMVAGAAMALSSVSVVLNSLRLGRKAL